MTSDDQKRDEILAACKKIMEAVGKIEDAATNADDSVLSKAIAEQARFIDGGLADLIWLG